MTDIHCHLIYDVDDGSRSLQESIELLQELNKAGFNQVIITPHFISGTEYNSDNELKLSRLHEIKEELQRQNINISVYLGNEIFINKNIPKLLEQGFVASLAGTKYLLIELPFHNKILGLVDLLYELTCQGYIPIIAHPERYTYFQENYRLVDSFKEEGILFQCNYASILGYYGKESEKLVKYLFKKHYVDYLGTDLHRLGKTFMLDNFKKIEKNIIKLTGKEYYREIVNNCNQLINE